MVDALSKTVEEIRQVAKKGDLRIFFGWLSEENHLPGVHWNIEHGGDWKGFLDCAKAVSATVIYLNWAPFEQFQVDEAVTEIEAKLAESDGSNDERKETQRLLAKVREFGAKVGLTCIIDIAFLSNHVVHLYQETADWFSEFEELLPEETDDEPEARKSDDKATVDKWALALASDPRYFRSKEREYVLEKLAGNEFSKLPIFAVLRRAEIIFQEDFKDAAEQKLVEEVRQLREQGLNLNAIAHKLGLSRDRVSGLVSFISRKE